MGSNHRRGALQALALPLSYPGVWRFFCCKDWDGFSHPSCIRSQLSCSWLLPCRRLLRRSWVWSMSCSCTPGVEHALSHATHIYSRMTGFATAMSWCLHQASNPIDRRMKAVRWPTPPCRLTCVLVSAFLVLEIVVRIHRSLGLAAIDLTVLACGAGDGLDLLL